MSGVSKTLNDYLFGGGGETQEITMPLSDWEDRYEPIENKITTNNNFYDGTNTGTMTHGYFETYGEDLEFVLKQNPLCVWTEIHASGSFEGINSGMMSVDRLLYYVTKYPREAHQFVSVDYHYYCTKRREYPECCEVFCVSCDENFLLDGESKDISNKEIKMIDGEYICVDCKEKQ